MEKTFNMTIEELRQNLYEMINNSSLPFSSVYYLFKDVMREMTDSYYEMVGNEFKQYEKENKEKEENTEDEETE